jgi:hypothetical protein
VTVLFLFTFFNLILDAPRTNKIEQTASTGKSDMNEEFIIVFFYKDIADFKILRNAKIC